MNQYYVWPDYATQTLNVAKIVYENQSYYVARRNGDDRLLCIHRKYLPHAVASAQRPDETANGLGWEGGWQKHPDACIVTGQRELEACRGKWSKTMKAVACERAVGRIHAIKAQIAKLEQQLREQRCFLQSTSALLSLQFGEDEAKEQPHE